MPGNDESRPPPREPAHIEVLQPTEPPTSSDSAQHRRQNINYDWRQAFERAFHRGPQLIDAALELASTAWEVFPCRPNGPQAKSPLTLHGHHEATMDPDLIKAWWRRWPNAMIGARVPDSCIVVDCDPRNGGDLEKLIALVGDLPPTLTVWSGRNDGGRHQYYQRPTGRLTSTRLPEGIDLKVNGYCIVPPSIHPATGMPYRWDERPVAPLPPRLRLLLCPPPQPVQTFTSNTKNGSGLIRKVAEATEGKRHDVLLWASFRARDDGILDDITDDLIAAAVSTGETETNARRTVASVRRAAP